MTRSGNTYRTHPSKLVFCIQGAEIELCQDPELELHARDGWCPGWCRAILNISRCIVDIKMHDALEGSISNSG